MGLAEGEKCTLANPNQIVSREVNSGFLKVFTFRYVEINTISGYTYHKWCTEMWCIPHHRLKQICFLHIFKPWLSSYVYYRIQSSQQSWGVRTR